MRVLLFGFVLVSHIVAAQVSSVAAYDVLVNPLSGFSVNVSVDKDPTGNAIPGHRIGESLRVTVVSDRDGYVYLFNVRADGTVGLIFPNEIDQDQRVLANVPRVAPSLGYTLDLAGPTGLDKVLAIATLVQLDLSQLVAEMGNSEVTETRFATALGSVLRQQVGSSWAVRTVAFYIGDDPSPPYGVLRVASIPASAIVYVNDVLQGVAPLALAGPPGNYTVRLEADGYDPHVETVVVPANLEVHLQVTLQAQLTSARIGRLIVNVNVCCATVHLNGEPFITGSGASVEFADLLEGQYELTVVAPGYHSQILPVRVEVGSTVVVDVELQPLNEASGGANP